MPKDNQDELFVVVDKNDKILGYKTRYECHHNKELIHRATGVVLFNDKGEILLQKRSMTKDTNPGLYTLSASGHVGKGESYEEAAERELFEEIGVKKKIQFVKKFLMNMKTETEMESIYIDQYNGPFTLDRTETDQIEFFTPKRIKQILPLLTPFAVESLRRMQII
ncbi:hypothetical protein A2866_03050 [Candidatus Roizmanbacteria bacterium RIFCSPHIGHO2_01_FULL_39_8]|uniref:Nudix hydrolase domain-containing protein n=2 Tax=Candidatus Roizmaniibacteriota TaxID=1752723 RepID=A0A1F7GGK5_9BACT|nr:MAG: hypothetical protein A2866_03050 [Candidatus Roizmanbacteria bacterium RIFCSPHIGHO2_01_FULL_39_8]OGK34869.1 MAG: hypothetical protein A3F60_05175 [Candidatus Roizmanbacteria bacterium RIFCSPHIGHO2_12_FULL_39_8]